MKKYFVSVLILFGLSGCDLPLPTYKLILNGKTEDTYVTKEACEKQAIAINSMARAFNSKNRATCKISFF